MKNNRRVPFTYGGVTLSFNTWREFARSTHEPGAAAADGGSAGRIPVSGDKEAKLDKLYGTLRQAQISGDRSLQKDTVKEIKALGGHA